MPAIVDTYTDPNGTLLADHTPDSGGTIAAMAFGFAETPPGFLEIRDNGLRAEAVNSSGGPVHRYETDLGSEYDIAATLNYHAVQANRHHALYARMTPAGTALADVDHYRIFFNGQSDSVQINSVVGGDSTTIAQEDATLVAASPVDVLVEVRTGSIRVFVATVEVLFVEDSSITQDGRVGVCASRGSSNQWMDDLTVTVVGDGDGAVDVDASQVAPAATQQASLSVDVDVDATQVAPSPTQQAEVTIGSPVEVDVAQTAPAATQSAELGVTVGVTATQVAPSPTQSAALSVDVGVELAQTAPAATQSAEVAIGDVVTVTVAQVAPAATQATTIGVDLGLVVTQTAPAATQQATATLELLVSVGQHAPAASQSANLDLVPAHVQPRPDPSRVRLARLSRMAGG